MRVAARQTRRSRASSLDFLQDAIEKIGKQTLQMTDLSGKPRFARLLGGKLCAEFSFRFLVPSVQGLRGNIELLGQLNDVLTRSEPLDGHASEFFGYRENRVCAICRESSLLCRV